MKDGILWHPDKHRLVYDVFDDTVRVLSCEGHYKNKNFDEYWSEKKVVKKTFFLFCNKNNRNIL